MKRNPLNRFFMTGLILMTVTGAAGAQEPATSDDLAALRREIEQLKEQIGILKEQVQTLIGAAAAPQQAPATTATPGTGEPAAPEAPAQAGAPPAVAAAPARTPSLLNPAISGVFQTIGSTSFDGADDENGFDLSEAEVAFQAAVDPYARMDLYLAFPVDETPEVEEGYVSSLSLPHSLMVKGGRFKSTFGKWNTLHTHAFFTVDRPLALEQHFGDESFTNDGLGLSVLISNPWGVYLESVTEVGTAREGPAFNSAERDITYLEHLSGVFDLSPNATLEVGLSAAFGRTGPTESLLEILDDPNFPVALEPSQNLDSTVTGVDVTFKRKPLQRNTYRAFLWQTEFLKSHRHVETVGPFLTLEEDSVTSTGGYTYLEGQFTKRWRFGGRYDWTELPEDSGAMLRSGSAVVRFVPSEFQEIRFQISQIHRNGTAADLLHEDDDDTRLFFEWIPVIGAHGAHKY